jgi:hypothetical protein
VTEGLRGKGRKFRIEQKYGLLQAGAIPLRSSTHLLGKSGSVVMNPVTLPPGRARLATKPAPIGSATPANTIGISRVVCRNAATTGVEPARSASGRRPTSSLAKVRTRSKSAATQR